MTFDFGESGFTFNPQIVTLLLEIHEFKGAWRGVDGFATALSMPLAESEDACLRALIEKIADSWQEHPLSIELVDKMEAFFAEHSAEPCDRIPAHSPFDAVDCPKVDADDAGALMAALIDRTNEALLQGNLPPLIVISMFAAHFFVVRPIGIQNDRLANALALHLLMRAGYSFLPYSATERLFSLENGQRVLLSRIASRTLAGEHPKWEAWITDFLTQLVGDIRRLKEKLDSGALLQALPPISARIVCCLQTYDTLSISETESLLHLNQYTLRGHFRRLCAAGYLEPVGNGRSRRYRLRYVGI